MISQGFVNPRREETGPLRVSEFLETASNLPVSALLLCKPANPESNSPTTSLIKFSHTKPSHYSPRFKLPPGQVLNNLGPPLWARACQNSSDFPILNLFSCLLHPNLFFLLKPQERLLSMVSSYSTCLWTAPGALPCGPSHIAPVPSS